MTQATRADVGQWGCIVCSVVAGNTWTGWAFLLLAVLFWIDARKAAKKNEDQQ